MTIASVEFREKDFNWIIFEIPEFNFLITWFLKKGLCRLESLYMIAFKDGLRSFSCGSPSNSFHFEMQNSSSSKFQCCQLSEVKNSQFCQKK